jgi:hypothetical protein
MIRNIGNILTVISVAFAVITTGGLGGNVLCMGDDGHLAIEPPHQGAGLAQPATASHSDWQIPNDDHGSCSDVAVGTGVAVRRTAVEPSDSVIAPVFAVALPAAPAAVSIPARAVSQTDAAQPATISDCLGCIILLN